jgi:calcium-dependent protein kinase
MDDDYNCEKRVLGSGLSGDVHMATSKHDARHKYAVKGFNLHGLTPEARQELANEAEIFLGMDHPHVARLVDVYESQTRVDLVMECMTGGELFERIAKKRRFSEKDAAHASWQMLLAVNYLHSKGIVHRDLKLENFLYETPAGDHLKLIDFGFSKFVDPDTAMDMSCGTMGYVAPEVLQKSYTSKCDMWSLGVTVFILVFGYMPFKGSDHEQMKAITRGEYEVREKIWEKVPATAQDFVKRLMLLDVDKRLSAEDALQHPWIVNRAKANSEPIHDDMLAALCSFSDTSLFKRSCLKVAAWSLTPEQRSKVRAEFLKLDTLGKGTITLTQLREVLKEHSGHGAQVTEEALHQMGDENEEIQYSEFLAAMVSTQIALNDNLLQETFRRFDTDDSGFITPDNLREVLGSTFDDEALSDMLKEADTNQDNKISLDEFMQYMKKGAKYESTVARKSKVTKQRNSQCDACKGCCLQ